MAQRLGGKLHQVNAPTELPRSRYRSTSVEYRLPHPHDPHRYAQYGYDPARRGYWAATYGEPHTRHSYAPVIHEDVPIAIRGGVVGRYDAMSACYSDDDPVRGLLVFLADGGFFADVDVHHALDVVRRHGVEALPERCAIVAEVLSNLDLAGG